METLQKPELIPLEVGKSLKTMKVQGLAGMSMPSHYSTKEAVIVIQEGEVLLKMPNSEQRLQAGAVFIIPAEVEHSLKVKKDFKAIAIMGIESEIQFSKQ